MKTVTSTSQDNPKHLVLNTCSNHNIFNRLSSPSLGKLWPVFRPDINLVRRLHHPAHCCVEEAVEDGGFVDGDFVSGANLGHGVPVIQLGILVVENFNPIKIQGPCVLGHASSPGNRQGVCGTRGPSVVEGVLVVGSGEAALSEDLFFENKLDNFFCDS